MNEQTRLRPVDITPTRADEIADAHTAACVDGLTCTAGLDDEPCWYDPASPDPAVRAYAATSGQYLTPRQVDALAHDQSTAVRFALVASHHPLTDAQTQHLATEIADMVLLEDMLRSLADTAPVAPDGTIDIAAWSNNTDPLPSGR